MCGKAVNHSDKATVCTAPRINCPRTLTGLNPAHPMRSKKGMISTKLAM